MKNKKIIISVLIVLSLLLIGAGTVYSIHIDKPEEQKEEENSKKYDANDPENYKVSELKSIQTPDNKIRLGSTRVYEQNGITGMMLNVVPYEDFEQVYLKITMKLSNTKEEVVIRLENLKTSVQVEHEVQTLNDWSTLKSWSVEIIPEEEANKIWESKK